MDRSLTVILPVKNAGRTLQNELIQLIETAPDLTQQFEVLMIDWGSSDHSEEIAMESIRQYPQLHWMRMSRAATAAAVIETGMQRATGDVIIARQHDTPLTPGALRKLWRMEMTGLKHAVTTPQGYMIMHRGAQIQQTEAPVSNGRSFRVDQSRDVSGRRPPMFVNQMASAGH